MHMKGQSLLQSVLMAENKGNGVPTAHRETRVKLIFLLAWFGGLGGFYFQSAFKINF